MALAAPGVPAEVKAHDSNAQLAVPFLFQTIFPSWFAGIGFAAIVIGALVPAAIMAIAAANLFARNIYKEYLRPNASAAEQTKASQWASLVVKLGALLFVLFVKQTYAIQFQLLGGIWIVQTFPAIVAGLYTRWFHRWALVIGWAVAMVFGTVAAYRLPAPGQPGTHFGASTNTLPIINHTIYIGLTGLVINLVISVVLTLVFRAVKLPGGPDETRPEHYVADPELPPSERIPVVVGLADST
jgi:SSS family solute:Na+ symporter